MSRIEKLKEMLIDSPQDSFLKHALALEYIKEGDDNAACKLFEEVLQNEPGYVGSYYHLGKLFERTGKPGMAIVIYEHGITECKKVNDRHAMNELQGAYDDLTT